MAAGVRTCAIRERSAHAAGDPAEASCQAPVEDLDRRLR